MISLDDEARALIDLARDARDPNEADRARVRGALAAQLGAAAGLGLAAGLASAATATGAGATVKAIGTGTAAAKAMGAGAVAVKAIGAGTVAAKLVGAVVLVSAALGVGASAVHLTRHARVATVSVADKTAKRSQRGFPVVAPTPTPGLTAPTPDQDEPEVSVRSADPRPAVAERVAPKTNEPGGSFRGALATTKPQQARDQLAAAPKQRSSSATPAVADEARLVHDGVVALRSGQAANALALFDRYRLLYPQGVLTQECDAERALALADLGRAADARLAIEQFLRMHPTSPLAARLRERERLLDRAHP